MKAAAAAPAAAAANPASTEEKSQEQKIDPESLDPLDPRRVSLDIFEVYCYEMIMTSEVGRRAFLIKKLRYMIHRLIGKQYDFGRLFNFTNLANCVARICGRHADYRSEDEDEESYELQDRLIDFDPEKWNKIIEQFSFIRTSLLRKDAGFTVLPVEIEEVVGADKESSDMIPEQDESVDPEIEILDEFSVTFFLMNKWIKFHACLSHLQPYLQHANEKGTCLIPLESIVAFDRAISDLFGNEDDNEYEKILRSLFSENRSGVLSLRSFEDIKKIQVDNSRIFDLERFQKKFIKLIRRWTKLVLPVPHLAKFAYGSTSTTIKDIAERKVAARAFDKESAGQNDEKDETSNESQIKPQKRKRQKPDEDLKPKSTNRNLDNEFVPAHKEESQSEDDAKGNETLANLRRKRKSTEGKVKDPLPEAVAQAASLPARTAEASPRVARLSAGGTKETMSKLYQKKKSAHQMTFDDSDEEISDDEMKISELPKRPKKSEEIKPTPQINIQSAGQRSGPKKRKRFTEEEDQAIMQGVDRFGVGKWTEIKSTYSMELRDRDNVQIKDRYRTLTKSAD